MKAAISYLELDGSSLVSPSGPLGQTREVVAVLSDPLGGVADAAVSLSMVSTDPSLGDASFQSNNVTVTNNSSSLFDNTAFWQNADGSGLGSGLDRLGFRVTNPSANVLMTITFDTPVSDLALHYWQIDTSGAQIISVNGETSGYSASFIQGSLNGSLTSPDWFISSPAGPFEYGSVAITGASGEAVSSVVLNLFSSNNSTDGYSMQITGTVIPEPSVIVMAPLGLLFCCFRGRKRKKV